MLKHLSCAFREIAEVCYIRYARRPDHKSVKHIATSGARPSLSARRYQPWHQIFDPAERKLAAIRLHSEGWSITSIASYLETSRHTIYDTLKRWADEGVAGLDAKPKNKGVRKATLQVRNEIRKLQKNPRLGEYRVHTALLRIGIEVSPATCGRIMAANRQLYGLERPPHSPPRPKLEMPFKASHRHEDWSADVRYIEEHLLPDPRPVYVITIFENFSRMVLSSKISATQNQWDYLSVLVDAIRTFGAPEAIVTDGGGIFYSNMALELYEMLGIRKERIEAGQPWQNFAETLLYVTWNYPSC